MEQDKKPPASAGMMVAGLRLVFSSGNVFLGRETHKSGAVHQEGNHIRLSRALQVIVELEKNPTSGAIHSRATPIPIPPFGGPIDIDVWASAVVRLDDDPNFGELYSKMTGASGLIIPRIPVG